MCCLMSSTQKRHACKVRHAQLICWSQRRGHMALRSPHGLPVRHVCAPRRAFRLYLSSKAGKAAVLRATCRHAAAALMARVRVKEGVQAAQGDRQQQRQQHREDEEEGQQQQRLGEGKEEDEKGLQQHVGADSACGEGQDAGVGHLGVQEKTCTEDAGMEVEAHGEGRGAHLAEGRHVNKAWGEKGERRDESMGGEEMEQERRQQDQELGKGQPCSLAARLVPGEAALAAEQDGAGGALAHAAAAPSADGGYAEAAAPAASPAAADALAAESEGTDAPPGVLWPVEEERLIARQVFFATLITCVGRVDRLLTMYDDSGSTAVPYQQPLHQQLPYGGLAAAAAGGPSAGPGRSGCGVVGLATVAGQGTVGVGHTAPRGGGGWRGGEPFRYGPSPFPAVEAFMESVCREVGCMVAGPSTNAKLTRCRSVDSMYPLVPQFAISSTACPLVTYVYPLARSRAGCRAACAAGSTSPLRGCCCCPCATTGGAPTWGGSTSPTASTTQVCAPRPSPLLEAALQFAVVITQLHRYTCMRTATLCMESDHARRRPLATERPHWPGSSPTTTAHTPASALAARLLV